MMQRSVLYGSCLRGARRVFGGDEADPGGSTVSCQTPPNVTDMSM